MLKTSLNKFLFIFPLLFLIVSCSSINSNQSRIWDPIEPLNRTVFSFNMTIDTYALEPIAKGYNYVVPEFVKKSLRNHFNWLSTPVSSANLFLQGKYEDTYVSIIDFSINALTLGLIDLTGEQKIDKEDFDQTLASFGSSSGPFLVIPFAGPTTLRGIGGTIIDGVIDPLNLIGTSEITKIKAVELPVKTIDSRALYMNEINKLKEDSLDPYALFRSIYFQRLQAKILDNEFENVDETSTNKGAIDAFFMQNQ